MYSCCGCFRPPCGGDRSHSALDDLEERLLDTFAGNVTRDARILGLAGNLVDLVDIDDSALAIIDIEVAGLEQPDEDVFDVLTDITRFGQCCSVCDCERYIEYSREGAREQSLACSSRSDEEDVGLVQLDIIILYRSGVDALVMVVHRYGEGLFGLLLPDHILVEDVLDFLGGRYLSNGIRNFALFILLEDFVAQRDALIADVN